MGQWLRALRRASARVVLGALLGGAGAAGLVPSAFAQPLPPAESFFEKPLLGTTRLSPDGWHLAMLVSTPKERVRLAVLDLRTMKPTIVASFKDADIAHVQWVNDRRLVFTLDVELIGPGRADTAQGLFAVDVDGTSFRQLVATRGEGFLRNGDDTRTLSRWDSFLYTLPGGALAGGDNVYVFTPGQRSADGADYFQLRRLDTRSGRETAVETPLHSVDWFFDEKGTLRAAFTQQGFRVATLVRQAGDEWKTVAEGDLIDGSPLRPRFIAPDGTWYVAAQWEGRSAVFTADLTTGKHADKPLVVSPDFDVDARFIANDQRLLGLRIDVDAETTVWLDPETKSLQEHVDRTLRDTVNRLAVPRRGNSPWVLVESFSDAKPMTTLLFNRETRKFSRVGSEHPSIVPAQMGTTEFVHITARDGRRIPAWLTLPPGANRKALPMVVFVHGGPWVRGGSWRWTPEVQFLASRGYAVLLPEFRGSTGYGRAHFEAGFGEWGRAMQHDVTDATRWAISRGTADPTRICIAGASYGGYATLMGLINEPSLYRCGFQWVGVTDIELMYSVHWSDLTRPFKAYGMPRMIGDPVKDAERLRSVSPLNRAAEIRQPLLLAYGAWDERVPIVHGEKFHAAVSASRSQVEWVVYPNEAHGWARLETQVDFWGRVERFLARHLAAQ